MYSHLYSLFLNDQVIKNEGWGGLYSGLKPSLFGTVASQVSLFFWTMFLVIHCSEEIIKWINCTCHLPQGVYYYFYQVFKNKAVAIAAARKAKGLGDGNVGMISWLAVAAIAG